MSINAVSKGVDQLSSSERAVLDEILSLARVEGVVTGVFINSEAWDLRPLVLDQGRLSVIRLLAPVRTPESSVATDLIKTLEQVFSLHLPRHLQPKIGFQAGKIWFSRPFVKQTLVDILSPFENTGPMFSASSLRPLFALLQELFKAGFAHGNLSLSNLTLDQNQLIPLDVCLHNLPTGGRSEADLEALQKILNLFRFEDCSPALVAEMLAIGSSSRAPLVKLEDILSKLSQDVSPAFKQEHNQLASPVAEQPKVQARGKLIKESVVLPLPAKEPKAVTPPPAQESLQHKLLAKVSDFSLSRYLNANFGQRRTQLIWGGVMIGFFGIAIIASGGLGFFSKTSNQAYYQKLWLSQNQEKQALVAEAALADPFSAAIDAIRAAALLGKSAQQSRAEILKLAFDERWFKKLSSADRKTVLSIALGTLIPAQMKEIAPFQKLYPGVLLALAGSVSLDNPGAMFADIPLEKFAELPEPFLSAFQVLMQLGVRQLQQLPARAYAHLVLGDANLNTFGNYFIATADEQRLRLQLKAVLVFFEQNPAMATAFEEFLAASGLPLQGIFNWFVADQTAQWVRAQPLQRVSILAGTVPPTQLALEQLIDLLQFPQREIRDQAARELSKSTLSKDYQSLLLVLASDENRLTRAQGIFLVSALQVPDEEAFAFLARWFSGEPDPDTVFLILLSRSRIAKPAPFDIEGARYLIDRQWQAATEELAELVRHPEPLARALAYSRLDPKRAADLKILKAQLSADSSERMRQQIKDKLQSAGIK
jgi:hypothetical protein